MKDLEITCCKSTLFGTAGYMSYRRGRELTLPISVLMGTHQTTEVNNARDNYGMFGGVNGGPLVWI